MYYPITTPFMNFESHAASVGNLGAERFTGRPKGDNFADCVHWLLMSAALRTLDRILDLEDYERAVMLQGQHAREHGSRKHHRWMTDRNRRLMCMTGYSARNPHNVEILTLRIDVEQATDYTHVQPF